MQTMDGAKARRAAAASAGKNRVKGMGHPTTAEMNYSPSERQFMFAMHRYRQDSGHQFPTWSEVLRVLKGLGYAQKDGPKEFVPAEDA